MSHVEATLFLAGDVMTGRGIDRVLTASGAPSIWGEALAELTSRNPDVRIGNLETCVTTSDAAWPNKRFRFRMHPSNTPCLTAAGFDCLTLANNHVLDWGYDGLSETVSSLQRHGLNPVGAGCNLQAASAPVSLDLAGGGRVLVFAWAHPSSYTPPSWIATTERPGVNLLVRLAGQTIVAIKRQIEAVRRPGDLVVASLHWGGNWSYEIGLRQRSFAHRLIDRAGVDVVHGHSSHHPKAVEIHRGRPILYGCGDFINDYGRHEENVPYRPELTAMYFLRMDIERHRLTELTLVPMRIEHFQLRRASRAETLWLRDALNNGGYPVDVRTTLTRWRRLKRTHFGRPWVLADDGTLSMRLRRGS